MTILACSADDCQRKVLARGLCSTHYSYWHRAQNKYTIKCEQCGAASEVPRPEARFCTLRCKNIYTNSKVVESPKWQAEVQRRRTLAGARPKPTRKTPEEIAAHHKSMRSDLRAGYEDGDYGLFLTGLRRRVSLSPSGCWEWTGPVTNSDGAGYALVRFSGKDMAVHRLVIEAREGKPLGVLAAHHKCANSLCVNPDHLQPVTHRENVAEMLARRSYEARIAELESALREVSPGHELLNRIGAVA